MDDPQCDPERLHNTYSQFATVNRWMTGWRRVFERLLEPRLSAGATLLDVGCGGGDLTREIAHWSRLAGEPLRVTGIDRDPRALEFARRRGEDEGVEYLELTAEELLAGGRRYDFVISNHLLHHLDESALPGFLSTTAAVGRKTVIHNDLRRHPAALAAFALTLPLFPGSFIVEDGLRSIRRSYTPAELRAVLQPDWRLESIAPFRNLLVLER